MSDKNYEVFLGADGEWKIFRFVESFKDMELAYKIADELNDQYENRFEIVEEWEKGGQNDTN